MGRFEKRSMNILLIPDGNRRWAVEHKMGFDEGYAACAKKLAQTFEALNEWGIKEVWVVACTVKNLSRPPEQVESFLNRFSEVQDFTDLPLGLDASGDLDALPEPFKTKYKRLRVPKNAAFVVHYLVPWSIDDEIMRLVNHFRGRTVPVTMAELMRHSDVQKPIDLIIRAGKVSRLSAMIPWQSPYAELHFVDKLWPDVTKKDIRNALDFYHRQERRNGL
jgi:undecaprenyl diphosphate synthase